MRDPFRLTEPVCISFSGGRTSAYMLHRFIERNNGLGESVVCFANTGKEEEASLEFVRDVSRYWNVDITWIEYDPDTKYKIVTFNTASRNGEPFEAIIRKRNYLPNPVARFCTIELKIRPIARYLLSLGLGENMSECENMSVIGIRADEPRRAAKIADKSRIPLFYDGVTKKTVGDFWKTQSFDLKLPNINGVTYHGNCDLCFLKGASQTMSLIEEKPERADWWIKMENTTLASKPSGTIFRKDRPSYEAMKHIIINQESFDYSAGDESIPCFCGE